MKAAIYTPGTIPVYGDFSEPTPQNDKQVLITVKASAIKNLDKGIVSGHHYSSETNKAPKVAGFDAIGELPDGTRVYGLGVAGVLAEKALIEKDRMVKVPDGLSDASAAALPNAIMGAGAAMLYRAEFKAGETILINGATGVTGKVAVQIAKLKGAAKIIATGRNEGALKELLQLGAHEVLSLKQDDEQIVNRIKEIHYSTPIDVVIDYLWGRPAELVFAALQGKGDATCGVRYVTVGAMAGDNVQLSSATLRSSDIVVTGSGLGSLARKAMSELFTGLIPEMFALAAEGRLVIDTELADLKDIETVWNKETVKGKRLVIIV